MYIYSRLLLLLRMTTDEDDDVEIHLSSYYVNGEFERCPRALNGNPILEKTISFDTSFIIIAILGGPRLFFPPFPSSRLSSVRQRERDQK